MTFGGAPCSSMSNILAFTLSDTPLMARRALLSLEKRWKHRAQWCRKDFFEGVGDLFGEEHPPVRGILVKGDNSEGAEVERNIVFDSRPLFHKQPLARPSARHGRYLFAFASSKTQCSCLSKQPPPKSRLSFLAFTPALPYSSSPPQWCTFK